MSFPQELSDMIIDEASKISGKEESTRALTSLSLVSRAFRDRAHGHLFASITFDGSARAMEAAQNLLGLLEVDHDTDTLGLASKITSFAYSIPQSGAGPLAMILNKLFRAEGRFCSLDFAFLFPYSWPSLPENLARAIFEVCHRPRLATLSIDWLYNIPRNFLQHSFIKRLTLDFVSVSDSQLPEFWFAGVAGQGHCEAVLLEYLDVSPEKRILPLLTTSQQFDPKTVFSCLQELHFHDVFDDTDLRAQLCEVLSGCQGQLGILRVWLARVYHDLISLPIGTLHNLHTFAMTVIPYTDTPLSNFAAFLEHIEFPPSLHNIELGFLSSLTGPTIPIDDMVIFDAFQKMGSNVLDDLFAQKKFDHVRYLSLQCNLYLHSPYVRQPEELERLLPSRFPHIASRGHLSFSVHVKLISLSPDLMDTN